MTWGCAVVGASGEKPLRVIPHDLNEFSALRGLREPYPKNSSTVSATCDRNAGVSVRKLEHSPYSSATP